MQVSFFGLLGLVFITLKLTGYIDWAWWVVLSPIWGIFVLIIGIIFIGVIYSVVTEKAVKFYVRKNK